MADAQDEAKGQDGLAGREGPGGLDAPETDAVNSAADAGDAAVQATEDADVSAAPAEADASHESELASRGETSADLTAVLGEGAEETAEPLVGSAEIKPIIEALIFASPEPLSLKQIQKLLDSEPKEDVAAAVEHLKRDYERAGGLQLVEVAGGFQIVTRPDLNDWVRRLFHERSSQKLSVQALETLAVIAYRQPITAAEIAEIRGVNTSGVINTLLERHLVKIVGRKAVVGRPFMYATTREFLIRFGLNDIGDLPKVQDMVDALGLESPLLVEQMTADEQLPLTEPDGPDSDDGNDGRDGNDVTPAKD